MEITKKWLKEYDACEEAIEWFEGQKKKDHESLIKALIHSKTAELEWGNWYLARRLTKTKKIQYTVFAARLVLKNYEDKYPNDDRPRKAIEAAEEYIKHPSKKNKSAAEFAARSAAESAAESAAGSAAWYAAESAAGSAAESAAWYAAWYAAESAAGSAAWYAARSAAGSAARYAARSAARSAAGYAAYRNTMLKILRYGLKLLLS